MAVEFAHPWLVMVSAAVALAAGTFAWRRNPAALLFVLGAAAFVLAAARPALRAGSPVVRHALVVDVSASMESRADAISGYADDLLENISLPSGHEVVRFELSDALRKPGDPRGDATRYRVLRGLSDDEAINGEVIFITDGQAPLAELQGAVEPARLIVMHPPDPESPDAAILSLRAPGTAPVGSALRVVATIRCDSAAEVPWRLLNGRDTVARGTSRLAAGVPAEIAHTHVVESEGLSRLRLVLELPGDREPRNDSASLAVRAGDRRVIYYCVPEGVAIESDGLGLLLQDDERNDLRVRHELPATSDELREAGVVIINNLALAASGVNAEQLDALADWVVGGGSLMMLGTSGAFGPGGYRATPIEDVMPVRFRPEDAPGRHVLMLLDASSSMDERVGGERKIDRLKSAGRRLIEKLSDADRVAVVGFREGLVGAPRFVAPGDGAVLRTIDELQPRDSTYIAQSLGKSLEILRAAGNVEDAHILLISDGEDQEGAGRARFTELAQGVAGMEGRLDVILTSDTSQSWPDWMANAAGDEFVNLWRVGGDGFEGLLETLERALADADREWILTEDVQVDGVATPLPRLVRTQLRGDGSSTMMLAARAPGDDGENWPLLTRRELLGRTVALCTDSWGDAGQRAFWQADGFRAELQDAIAFLLENAGHASLALNPMPDDSAELAWIGGGEPPRGALRTDAGDAIPVGRGRWSLAEFPQGEELRVLTDGRLLQRIPLPDPVPAELRLTGNDASFFAAAEDEGLRVYRGLGAWTPQRFGDARQEPIDLTWLATLAALALMISGYAVRRRR